MTVKKDTTKNKYYSLEVQEMELMPERSTKGEGSLNPDNSTNSISAIKLLQGVEKSNSHPPWLLRRASCYGFLTFIKEVSSNADKFKNGQLKIC